VDQRFGLAREHVPPIVLPDAPATMSTPASTPPFPFASAALPVTYGKAGRE
jgi:hypothetical protein